MKDVPCNTRQHDLESVTCLCNGTHCDYVDIPWPEPRQFTVITSSKSGMRFHVESFTNNRQYDEADVELVLDWTEKSQEIYGFGGSFTDSTGINIMALSKGTQDNILKSYFGVGGIGYNLCRVPIGGTDFSPRPYSYDDVKDDVTLDNFALTEEDYKYKIPLIMEAKRLSRDSLRLFASPWSPPAWMKTNGMLNGTGFVLREMWKPLARYIIKFLQAYSDNGISMWGLTPQNQPEVDEQRVDVAFNNCGWKTKDMREWIKWHLGPQLKGAGFGEVKVMVHDFNRNTVVERSAQLLMDEEANKYVDGIALHWYSDSLIGPECLDLLHSQFPDKFILYTEACEGFMFHQPPVVLGSWERGENYFNNILENLNHWASGWVDWNMALDLSGGPNWVNNMVDSPIIVDEEKDEFHKQPTFYAIGHFSKFISPGAVRIEATSSSNTQGFDYGAFMNPDSTLVLLAINKKSTSLAVRVQDTSGTTRSFEIPPKAFQTIIFNQENKNIEL